MPNQKPEHVRKIVTAHLRKICPPTVRLEISAGHGAEAYHVSPSGPLAQASLRALRRAFGAEPILMREGGSIPIVNDFKKILGADTLLLGLALPAAAYARWVRPCSWRTAASFVLALALLALALYARLWCLVSGGCFLGALRFGERFVRCLSEWINLGRYIGWTVSGRLSGIRSAVGGSLCLDFVSMLKNK